MKRFLVALLLVVALALVACPATTPSGNGSFEPGTRDLPPIGDSPSAHITYEGNQKVQSLTEGFGVYGSKVELDGIYPGWSGIIPLTILNGQDRDRLFVLSVQSPSNPKEGYEPLPEKYLFWVNISQPTITVIKGGSYQVPITVTMPDNADYKGKKAEVRILIEDTTQTGLVQIAVESRWFIITED